jgi:hypothetical protein
MQVVLLYLGNLSASSRTVSIPSRAKAAEQYDPAGPPPTTNTWHRVGTFIVLFVLTRFVVANVLFSVLRKKIG